MPVTQHSNFPRRPCVLALTNNVFWGKNIGVYVDMTSFHFFLFKYVLRRHHGGWVKYKEGGGTCQFTSEIFVTSKKSYAFFSTNKSINMNSAGDRSVISKDMQELGQGREDVSHSIQGHKANLSNPSKCGDCCRIQAGK